MSLRLPVLIASLVCLAACGAEPMVPDRADRASADPLTSRSADADPGDAANDIAELVVVDIDSNNHVEERVDYDTYPPLGGDHFPIWQDCAFYDEPVVDEAVVHSLEHGAVWVAYREDAPSDELELLADRVGTASHLLASPYPDLRAPFVVTAWGRQIDLDTLSDPRFDRFVEVFMGGGAAPEPGAACDGGVGGGT